MEKSIQKMTSLRSLNPSSSEILKDIDLIFFNTYLILSPLHIKTSNFIIWGIFKKILLGVTFDPPPVVHVTQIAQSSEG